jgi:hypothetical protein
MLVVELTGCGIQVSTLKDVDKDKGSEVHPGEDAPAVKFAEANRHFEIGSTKYVWANGRG